MEEEKSIYTRWCYACVHRGEIPENLLDVASTLSKEYKHIIYCRRMATLIVANDNMWIDKTDPLFGCEYFERVQE